MTAAGADNALSIGQFGLHRHVLNTHTQTVFIDSSRYAVAQVARSENATIGLFYWQVSDAGVSFF